jgi:hypothetical protein
MFAELIEQDRERPLGAIPRHFTLTAPFPAAFAGICGSGFRMGSGNRACPVAPSPRSRPVEAWGWCPGSERRVRAA